MRSRILRNQKVHLTLLETPPPWEKLINPPREVSYYSDTFFLPKTKPHTLVRRKQVGVEKMFRRFVRRKKKVETFFIAVLDSSQRAVSIGEVSAENIGYFRGKLRDQFSGNSRLLKISPPKSRVTADFWVSFRAKKTSQSQKLINPPP